VKWHTNQHRSNPSSTHVKRFFEQSNDNLHNGLASLINGKGLVFYYSDLLKRKRASFSFFQQCSKYFITRFEIRQGVVNCSILPLRVTISTLYNLQDWTTFKVMYGTDCDTKSRHATVISTECLFLVWLKYQQSSVSNKRSRKANFCSAFRKFFFANRLTTISLTFALQVKASDVSCERDKWTIAPRWGGGGDGTDPQLSPYPLLIPSPRYKFKLMFKCTIKEDKSKVIIIYKGVIDVYNKHIQALERLL